MIQSSKIFSPFLLGMLSVVFLTSCSSYRNVNSNSDGIYGSSIPSETRRSVSNDNLQQRRVNPSNVPQKTSDTYSKFFSDQGQMISEARNSNNEVFTDIDNYASDTITYPEEERYYEEPIYNGNNAGWGTNPTAVIHIQNFFLIKVR